MHLIRRALSQESKPTVIFTCNAQKCLKLAANAYNLHISCDFQTFNIFDEKRREITTLKCISETAFYIKCLTFSR